MALVGPDLVTELVASILGVFVGVLLALLVDRTGERRAAARQTLVDERQLREARSAVLGSVVKNVSEAKRLKRLVTSDTDPLLLGVAFEMSVWDATRDGFLARAPTVEERVVFTRFFDEVSRTAALVSFHRALATGASAASAEGLRGRQDLRERLATVADDLRLAGTVVVTDHGEDVHKDMLGLRADAAQA